ncbi:MAG: type 1 glutamine amidotransferase [Ktedonobacteraceae bacterium]|nr:type 1 glutamine amidotransferase [Ktedonobacteraceae bacterium]
MQKVLILQHMQENPMGFVGTILNEYAIDCDVIHVEREVLPDPINYAAIIALGGDQHVYDDEAYPYFRQEKVFIQRAIEHAIPFLGLCLGAQVLAAAVGGKVKRHTMTEVGFFDVQLTEAGEHDVLFTGLPGYQRVFHWHEDTFDLPSEAVLLATSENTENQAFRYGPSAYGLQYHIELDDSILNIWLHEPALQESMISTLGPEGYQALVHERSRQMPIYQEHTRIVVKNFLHNSGLLH